MNRNPKIISLELVIIIFLFILSACTTLKDNLKEAERNNTLPQAIWQAFSKLEEEPNNEEVRQLVEEFGYKTITYLIQKGKDYLFLNEYTLLMDCFYFSNNSAVRIIDAYKRLGFYHPEQNTPDSMRSIIENRLDAYYESCLNKFKAGDFASALECFKKMKGLKDADSYISKSDKELSYKDAMNQFLQGNYRKAYELFSKIYENFKDVYTKKKECIEKGRVLVAFTGFTDNYQRLVVNRFQEKIANDLFIKLINIEDIINYNSSPAKYIYIIKGSFNLKKSDYFDPYSEQINNKAWSVSGDKKIVRTFKSNNSVPCTTFVYRANEINYSIRRVLIDIEVKASYEIVDARRSKVFFSDVINSSVNEDFKYNYYNGSYAIASLSLRNAMLDTITVCDNIKNYNFNFSTKDREFQALFSKKKDISSRDNLINKAYSDLAIKVAEAIYAKISNRD